MKRDAGIIIFALLEIFIGSITLIAVISSLIQGKSTKPLEVLVFVLITATISTALGIGILRHNLTSYHLLLYLSSIIIFSKILILTKIISLSGALETSIPTHIKNIISVFYHAILMFYFTRKSVRTQFGERREVLFSLPMPSLRKKDV